MNYFKYWKLRIEMRWLQFKSAIAQSRRVLFAGGKYFDLNKRGRDGLKESEWERLKKR